MRKLIIVSILFFSYSLSSQSAFFNTGLNTTSYDYKNSKGESNSNVQSSNGNFYEIGYSFPLEISERSRTFGRY